MSKRSGPADNPHAVASARAAGGPGDGVFPADVLPTTSLESDDSPSLLLRRAEHALRMRIQPALDAEGLAFEHWQILAVLLARPGSRMSDIADAAVVPAATLTRHMDRLVERALVVRRIDPGDKRSTVAALSAMGRVLAQSLRELERAGVSSLAEGSADSRIAALVGELRHTG